MVLSLPLGRLVATFVVAAAPLGAQAETPPNVKCPIVAATIDANDAPPVQGAFCISGALEADQRHVLWTVPASDERTVWKMRLAGSMSAPTLLKVVAVSRDAAGALTAVLPQFELATPRLAATAELEGILLSPGTYLIAIASADPVPFQVQASPAFPISAGSAELTARNAAASASVASVVSAPFVIGPADAAQRWRLEIFAPPVARGAIELRDTADASVLRRTSAGGTFALHDLVLPEGRYTLRYELWDGVNATLVLRLLADGPRVPTRESEPNDTVRTAGTLALARTLTARIGEPGDVDVFRFEPPTNTQVDVRASGKGAPLELCLVTAEARALQCRSGAAPRLTQLVLEGPHYVTVRGSSAAATPYELGVRAAGMIGDDTEIEPNDTAVTALHLAPGEPRDGVLAGEDVDAYHFVADGEPSLWELQAEGSGLTELWVTDRDGLVLARKTAEAPTGAAALALRDVFLPPAPYTLVVKGSGGRYRLTAAAKGKPDLRIEREPNPDQNPNRIRVGAERIGTLSDLDDRDAYRFSLAAPTHVALTLTPPAGGNIDMEIEWGWPELRKPTARAVKAPTTYRALLDPGDYLVRLRPNTASDGTYTLGLAYADPFALPGDLEPNDSPSQARPLPPGLVVDGRVGDFGDADWYRLPVAPDARTATFSVVGGSTVRVTDGEADVPLAWSADRTSFSFEIAALRELSLGIEGSDAYRLSSTIEALPASVPPGAPLAAALQVRLAQPSVAAYWIHAQRLEGHAVLSSGSPTPLELTLDAQSSHVAYAPSLAERRITLAPGASIEVPFTVSVAPDARAGIDAQIALRARDAAGAQVTATAVITADAATAPVADERAFALPAALRGGFNVASPAYGGRARTDQDANEAQRQAVLFDGFIGAGFTADAATAPVIVTRVFGGSDPWPIAGINLHPQVADRLAPAEQLHRFELLLSDDGVTFTPALAGELSMLPVEQAFTLPEPRAARAAQLKLIANHASNIGQLGLNEWQVITTPAPTALQGVQLNAADPDRGAHIVWSTPLAGTSLADVKQVLSGIGARPLTVQSSADRPPRFALGFRDGRAVQITRITWQEATTLPAQTRPFGDVHVAASLDGPLGPWRDLGQLAASAPGASATLDLPDGTWARYVRFTAQAQSGAPVTWLFPAKLTVLERPITAQSPSALAEWGLYSRASAFEAAQPARPPVPVAPADTSRAAPAALELGRETAGVVQHGAREDWYGLRASADGRRLRFTLTGEPTIDADVTLFAAEHDGAPLPLDLIEQAATRLVFEAEPAPNVELRLRVYEPGRSVAVAYDTSASLAHFTPFVRQATAAFAEGVVPGHEFMNIMNFERPFLLPEFADQPWVLQGALAGVPSESDSSNLEATMLPLADALLRRKGTRAVILVTDAESGGHALQEQMWTRLDQLQPHVFAAHLGLGSDMQTQTQVLQDLAAISGGVYSRAMAQADLDVVAERAAAWLRRPVRYRLLAEPAPLDAMEPGAIQVVAASAVSGRGDSSVPPARGVLEIVLDASGSMLQRLDGAQRIEIARQTLNDVLREAVADEANVALRVFGDDEPGSCDTRLAVPPGPLDRAAIAAVLERVQPQNGARTPIGASLAAVADDLAAMPGARTIVLITDGEETCGGDPQTEIEKLAAAGIEVRVNIVGFAVDDAGLRAQFEAWAKLGRGSYFDAAKADDLGDALAKAMGIEFRVLGSTGIVAAQGIVGSSPVALPPGRYRVEIDGGAAFEDVAVRTGETTALEWRE